MATSSHPRPIAPDPAPGPAGSALRHGSQATRGARVTAGALAAWSLTGAGLWLAAALVCPAGRCGPTAWDRQVLDAVALHAGPRLDAFFAAATWAGSIVVLLPAALALAWRGRAGAAPGLAALLPLATAGAWLLAQGVKWLVERPRPDLHAPLIAMPVDFSFPSAHSMQIAAFATAWLLAPPGRPAGPRLAVTAALVLLVAWSRLHLQVHYPTDVLAGLAAGALWTAGLRAALGERA